MVAITIVVAAFLEYFNPSFQFSWPCINLGHYYLILLPAFSSPFSSLPKLSRVLLPS